MHFSKERKNRKSIDCRLLFYQLKNDLQHNDKIPSNASTKYYSYLAFAIIATIISICIVLLIIVMRKRIKLVVQLFKEAGKAVSAMPLIIFQPILVSILFVKLKQQMNHKNLNKVAYRCFKSSNCKSKP